MKHASFSRGWQLSFSFEGKVSRLIGKPERSILSLSKCNLLFRVYQVVQWVQYLCGIQVGIKRWRTKPKVLLMTLERCVCVTQSSLLPPDGGSSGSPLCPRGSWWMAVMVSLAYLAGCFGISQTMWLTVSPNSTPLNNKANYMLSQCSSAVYAT